MYDKDFKFQKKKILLLFSLILNKNLKCILLRRQYQAREYQMSGSQVQRVSTDIASDFSLTSTMVFAIDTPSDSDDDTSKQFKTVKDIWRLHEGVSNVSLIPVDILFASSKRRVGNLVW